MSCILGIEQSCEECRMCNPKGEKIMNDGFQLTMNQDGAFEIYDDTYDIVIHCTNEEEKRATIEKLNSMSWIPADKPPKNDDYILLSFENFSGLLTGRYDTDEDGNGAYYLGDCCKEDTCTANNLFVNAWMPLPEPYKGC